MTVTHALKPTGYDSELSEFEACIFDGFSGKPIGWGFGIQQFLGEPRFNALRQFGTLEYCDGS